MGSGLRIATSQFPVSGNMGRNLSYIERHMAQAADAGAQVVHFPEAALTGYGRVDFSDFADLDLAAVKRARDMIAGKAKELNVWVVYGAYRRDDASGRLRNSLHVVSNRGRLVTTYDKVNLHGRGEVRHCEPGDRIRVFKLNGVACGLLICFDMCFPDLFERYRERGVKVLFLSTYNARNAGGPTELDDLMKATVRTRAADYGMWISASNPSARHSRLAACVARPDGALKGLPRHRTGILCHDYPGEELGWTYDNRTDRIVRE